MVGQQFAKQRICWPFLLRHRRACSLGPLPTHIRPLARHRLRVNTPSHSFLFSRKTLPFLGRCYHVSSWLTREHPVRPLRPRSGPCPCATTSVSLASATGEARPKCQWVHSSKYSGILANYESGLLILKVVGKIHWCHLAPMRIWWLHHCMRVWPVASSSESRLIRREPSLKHSSAATSKI
jgi:hypothetical protein